MSMQNYSQEILTNNRLRSYRSSVSDDAGVYDLTIKKAEKTRIMGVFTDPHLEKITKI